MDVDIDTPLHYYLDAALTTCAFIQEALVDNSIDLPHIISTHVVAHVRHVILRSMPDTIPLSNPNLVSPRHPIGGPNPLQDFITSSTSVSVLAVRPVLPHSHGLKDAEMLDEDFQDDESDKNTSVSESTSESLSSESGEGTNVTPEVERSQRSTNDGGHWDAKLNFHVLRESKPSSTIWLSMFCVGKWDNIFCPMASILYQRHSLGVTTPVIGFVLDDETGVLVPLLGWLEDTSERILDLVSTKLLVCFTLLNQAPSLLSVSSLTTSLSISPTPKIFWRSHSFC